MSERPRRPSAALRVALIAASPILALTAFGVAGALQEGAPEPRTLDENHRFGAPKTIENLTVWPVLTDRPTPTPLHISLARAQAAGEAVVRERDEAGAVGELVIENRGHRPIYVPGGTIVKGGKQDRQIGIDLVVVPGATVPVEAYCVERGRWQGTREGEETKGRFEVPKVMAAKRARASALYEKSQSEVWRRVDEINLAVEKAPPTATLLATLEDEDREARAQRKRMGESVAEALSARAGGDGEVVGFAYAIDGEPIAVRVFANRAMLEEHLAPFLETMSVEADVARRRDVAAGRRPHRAEAPLEAVITMVQGIERAAAEQLVTAAGNRIDRRAGPWGGQQSCLVPGAGDEWVPLARDWTAPADVEGELREALERLEALGYAD